MPTFHFHPVTGNNASSGADWANAKRDPFAYAASAGDILKIAQSPAPVLVSNDADWTEDSKVVELAASPFYMLQECDGTTGWTNGTNGTWGANTSIYKLGTDGGKANNRSSSLAVAAGAAAGEKLGWCDLGADGIDLSGYQRISFIISINQFDVTANSFRIKLCSDQSGDTPVDEFIIPKLYQSGQAYCLTLDKGAALGSSIKSIAIYTGTVDFGACTITLDNIVACTATGITLNSLVSPGNVAQGAVDEDEIWYPVKCMRTTKVLLDAYGGYPGTTITAGNMYHREAFRPNLGDTSELNCPVWTAIPQQNTTAFTCPSAGSDGNEIQYEGGWNPDTDLQTGETWFDCITHLNGTLLKPNHFTYFNFINNVRGAYHLSYANGLVNHVRVGYMAQVAGDTIVASVSGGNAGGIFKLDIGTLVFVGKTLLESFAQQPLKFTNFGQESSLKNLYVYCASIGVYPLIYQVTGYDSYWGRDKNGVDGIVKFKHCNDGMLALYGNMVVYNLNIESGAKLSSGNPQFYMTLHNPTMPGFAPSGQLPGMGQWVLKISKMNGVEGDNRLYKFGAFALHDTSIKDTGYDGSWVLYVPEWGGVSGYWPADRPFALPLSKRAVEADKEVTITGRMYRNHANLSGGLRVRGGQVGLTVPKTASISGTSAWEDVVITFTPTEAGVFEIEAMAWPGQSNDYTRYVAICNLNVFQEA